jgi:hypothetical protein
MCRKQSLFAAVSLGLFLLTFSPALATTINLTVQGFIPGLNDGTDVSFPRGLTLSADQSKLYAAYWHDASSSIAWIFHQDFEFGA